MTNTTLQAALDKRSISVAEAARKTGAKYITIWRHCNGSRPLSGDTAKEYADALGIPRWELRPDLWPPPASDKGQGTWPHNFPSGAGQ